MQRKKKEKNKINKITRFEEWKILHPAVGMENMGKEEVSMIMKEKNYNCMWTGVFCTIKTTTTVPVSFVKGNVYLELYNLINFT